MSINANRSRYYAQQAYTKSETNEKPAKRDLSEALCSPRQREIMEHALGRNYYNRTKDYRNRFVTDEDSEDGRECMKMVDLGWMRILRRKLEVYGGMTAWCVTEKGKIILSANTMLSDEAKRSSD